VTVVDARRPRRAVFLDRDGVLNRAAVRDGRPHPPSALSEAELLPDALPACQALKAAGATLVVVTNQPDVRRGTTPAETVAAINAWILSMLPLDDIRVCLHDDEDDCDCRKPKPGLLVQAAADWGVELAGSIMVGGTSTPVSRRAAARSILTGPTPSAARRPPISSSTSWGTPSRG
jgi:D-glycero-D-manno-heptose 1,7-bisphosphate phosphatase